MSGVSRVYAVVLAIVLMSGIASADVGFIGPTPPNGSTIYVNHTTINASIVTSNLTSFVWNWNGTNSTFLNDSCVLHMSFDNNSEIGDNTTVAVDVSQYGNNGSFTNGSTGNWTADGKWNGAMRFDGVNDRVNCGDNADLRFGTGNFTLSSWVKLKQFHAETYPAIMGKGSIASTEWMFRFMSVMAIEVYGAGNIIAATSQITFLDIWRHCVFVRDGDDGYIYVDGEQAGHSSGIAAYDFSTTKDLLIGNADSAANRYFNGSIDEVRIYNRALSPEEIKQLHLSNLRMHNASQWYFETTQTDLPDGTHNYQAFANNTNTEYRTLTYTGELPPNPITLANTTGNFWVNHTWAAGTGNVTDSYNVSVNSVWHNTSPAYYNDTYSAHAWQNITVYAYSNSGTLSSGNVSQDTQIPNNAITITNTSGWSGNEGANVYVDYDATDLDSDTPTFSCNRTDLFADFSTVTGKGNWTAAIGTYYVDFGVSDGYGSTDNYTMTITAVATFACACGDICVNETGWWHDGGAFNASGTPIQAAVTAASSYDTVYVWNGTYTENIDVSTAHLTLEGEDRDVVTVNAMNPGSSVMAVNAQYVNISGFTAKGAVADVGLSLVGSDCNIFENTLLDNHMGIFGGMCSNNVITNNNVINCSTGIKFMGAQAINISNNTITNSMYCGIEMTSNSYNNNIMDNSLSYNRLAVSVQSSNNNNFTNNNIFKNIFTFLIVSASDTNFTNNTVSDNLYAHSNSTSIQEGSIGEESNLRFVMKTINNADCPMCSYDLALFPSEASLQHSRVGAVIEGNFTPTRIGIYSLRINVTDSDGNSETRKYIYLINTTLSRVTYYFREVLATHGQPTTYGSVHDAGSLLLELPVSEESVMCSCFIGFSIDALPNPLFGIYKEINYSIWYATEETGHTGIQRYGNITDHTDQLHVAPIASNAFSTFNFTDVNWATDYLHAWYHVAIKLRGRNTYIYSNATHPSYANITYAYSTTPAIKAISNEGVLLLSATSPATDNRFASIVLDGEGATNLSVQMPNSGIDYNATYDGSPCNDANCSFTQSNGELNFTLTLGSIHTLNITGNIATPPDPTTLANTTGNFWVNHTWAAGSGNITDSYNVSVNQTWHNGTTNAYWNNTGLSAHGWSNVTVYAWNNTAGGTLSSGNVSQDTQIPNNAITITNTSGWSGNEGANVYVDYDATDLDSDTPTFSCNRTDLFMDFSTVTGKGNWTAVAGTYYIDFGVSDGYGSTSNYTMTITVAMGQRIPPDPTTLANTTGNFWVNHTWAAGSGNVTDSYNVSVNQTWYNTTTNAYWNNTGLSAHGWSNVTVYAWNSSGAGTLSSGNVSQDTQIPNNAITITNTSGWSGNEGANVYVDYDATDLDSDTPTFSCNRTDLFADFSTVTGTGNWTPAANGTYSVDFGVSDGYGSTSNYTMTIAVVTPKLNFTDPTPANESTIYVNHTTINASIQTYNLAPMVWNWNGTNSTFLNDSCVLHMSFDNNSAIGDSSSVAVDVSQHSNNGSLTGGVTSTLGGKYNGAFAFDESIPTYVRCEHSESLNITYEITLEAWIKASEMDGDDVIISKGPQWYIELNDSRPSFTWVYDVPYIGIDVVSPDVIELDKWYHIVGVYDRECGRIYVDGIEKANMSVLDNDSLCLSYPLLIGSYMTSMHVNFNGTIDEVRIYNRALTPEEIKQAYRSNLWKHNTTQWYFTSNQTDLPDGTHNYQAFANNINTEYRILDVDVNTPPASITNLQNATGNFWHNWTWTNPTDADFNHTTIYINNSWITNTSNEYYNLTASPHNQSTISTHTVDANGNMNSTWVNYTSIISNNAITITNTSGWSGYEGANVYVDYDATDLDSDTPIFSCNRTDLFADFSTVTGKGNWTAVAGTYYIDFGVSDGYGSTSNYTMTIAATAIPTVVTLLAQNPPTIYRNSTGTFNVSWGISHSSAGLNDTSVSLIWTVYDVVVGCYNHSIRPPSNDKAAPLIVGSTNYGKIQRGDNRNDTLYFENNVTITGGNVYHWSGGDEQTVRLSLIPVNTTYSKVLLNSSFAAMLGNMYYLDRTDQQSAVMTEQKIYKNHPLLIKIWDLERMKTRSGHIIVGYADTHMAGSSTNGVSVYYLNSSYDPAGSVDPLDSPYAAYISAHTESTWVDYVHTIRNSTYIKTFEVNETSLPVNTTPTGYLYFTSNEPSQNKAFCINITDDTTITNRSFADTSTLWTGTSAPLTSELYTPNVFISWRNNDRQFQTKLYAADNNDVWGNSTLHTSDIEVSSFDPTIPTINHFHFDSTTDYVMNGTYSDTIAVGVGVATDPDGGSVTHNLSLWYANRTFVAVINNTFTDADRTNLYAHIDFNTIPYYSETEKYTLKVVATDDEACTSESWLGVNFTLDKPVYPPPDPTTLQNTTGNFWVNHTWQAGSGNVTDSYNVSVNQTWYNTTTNTYWNNTGLSAHGWSNITVYAWNNSAGTLSSGNISQDTQIPNNAITITNTSGWSGNEGANVYVDYDATDADSDTPIFSCNRTDLFADFSTVTGKGNWTAVAGTYYIDFGVSDGYGSTSNYTMTITVAMGQRIPPDPTTLANTTGNFWVNHTWQAGSGNVTDSYNVSVNQTWHNGTTHAYWNNTGLSAHGWSNVTVYAWNNSGELSAGNISQDTQIPNNDPGAGSPSPNNGATGISTSPTLQVTVTDADTDNMSVRFYEQGGSQIGSTQTNIISGSTASVVWSGRGYSTTYYWYVTTNDTYNETTSTVWHFTTHSGGGPSHQVTITDCSNRQTTEGGEIYNDFNYTNDDSDVPVFTTNATVGTLNSSTGIYNWTTGVGDAGVYVWWFRATNLYGNYDTCTVTFTVSSSDVQPPTNLQHTTGNFWIRHSWTPGANTDSFNVSVNSAWHNTTTNAFWDNAGMSAHGWSNISIAGYNSTTGNLSSFIGEDTQVPNNPITITNTSDWNGEVGENVYVDYDSTDADSDTPTYSCSRTDLFTDFSTVSGTGNWTPAANGTYSVDFGVSDGWGSTSNHTMTIRVGVGIITETKVPVSIFITLTVLMLCGILYVFHARTHISRIFTALIATWLAFMLSQMIVSGNVVRMVSALDSGDTWVHDTVAIQIPGLSYLLLFIGVIMSIFLVKFVIVFGLAVIKEAQREEM